jgi:hypothetical protein
MTSKASPTSAKIAKQILGFYDTIPAADQQAFAAGLVELLSGYPLEVQERSASPSRGLPARVAYPNIAKFREHLEVWAEEHRKEVKERSPARTPIDIKKRLPPPLAPDWDVPGRLANIFVYEGHPRHQKLCEWAKTAELKWWKYGHSSDDRAGIWVPLSQWQGDGTGTLGMKAMEAAR